MKDVFGYEIEYDTDDDLPEENKTAAKIQPDFYHPDSARTSNQTITEVFVDPGYELDSITPREEIFLKKLRERYWMRKEDIITFRELKSACYKIGNELQDPISDFHIIHLLRSLWRAGYLRRYVSGKAAKTRKQGRGEWHGVCYQLYPKGE